jgi:hypothetical protein
MDPRPKIDPRSRKREVTLTIPAGAYAFAAKLAQSEKQSTIAFLESVLRLSIFSMYEEVQRAATESDQAPEPSPSADVEPPEVEEPPVVDSLGTEP